MKLKTLITKRKYLFDPRNYQSGFCTVCSKKTLFVLTGPKKTIRNHAHCIRCKSISRERHVARCILGIFSRQGTKKIQDFRSNPNLKVYIASTRGAITSNFGISSNIITSEFFDGCRSGEIRDGFLCQDLECLSFKDNLFDLVITEDVLEHLKDYQKGFEEIFRVLKKGGYHIFTVPYYFSQKTRSLFKRSGDKLVPAVFPLEYHDDFGGKKVLTYTHFGYDLAKKLQRLGFEMSISIPDEIDGKRYGISDCYTFITKKI